MPTEDEDFCEKYYQARLALLAIFKQAADYLQGQGVDAKTFLHNGISVVLETPWRSIMVAGDGGHEGTWHETPTTGARSQEPPETIAFGALNLKWWTFRLNRFRLEVLKEKDARQP